MDLDKINHDFRYLVDLLFFTDRSDIDLSNFLLLLDNKEEHIKYLLNRLEKSSEIHWEEGEQFWVNRISFLLSLNNKSINKFLGKFFEKRFAALVKFKKEIHPKYDLSYLQFLQFCKAKYLRGESLNPIKQYLLELPATTNDEKLLLIINSFIPFIFNNIDEYVELITQKITSSARNFEILQALEKRNIIFDRAPILQLAKEILIERSSSYRNTHAFLTILSDSIVLQQLKKEYSPEYKNKIIELLSCCDYKILENNHYKNIENLIKLDNNLIDDIALLYINKMCSQFSFHRKANINRIIKLLKKFNQISSKKILVYLSSQNKTSDVKYLIKSYPELEKFSAFI